MTWITLALPLAVAACSDKSESGADAAPPDGASAGALYTRLGGATGINAVVTDFVGRVVADPAINGYFLNANVDATRLVSCLDKQIGAATGGPEVYDCRDMRTTHAGLHISDKDFTDLAGHLVAALKAKSVADADVQAIVDVVTPLKADIVTDTGNNGTVYQRVGRKPAIATVVDKFVARVVADSRINGFFSSANAARLKTCLVRQVCSIDGPCKYGMEVDSTAEAGVSKANPCKDMMTLHASVTNPPGGGSGAKITKADFDALVSDLVTELTAAGVSEADKTAILGALGPLCTKIVANGTGC